MNPVEAGKSLSNARLGATLLVLGIALFVVCASSADAAQSNNFWNLDRLSALGAQRLTLTDDQGHNLATISGDRLRTLDSTRRRLERALNMQVDIYLATDQRPQVFSSRIASGRNLICLTLPMFDELGNVDALAAVLAHEFAHLFLDHEAARLKEVQDLMRAQRTAFDLVWLMLSLGRVGPTPPMGGLRQSPWSPVVGGLAQSAAIAAGIGVTVGIAADSALGAFTREQERSADLLAIELVARAGFDHVAASKLLIGMVLQETEKFGSYISIHPSDAERIEAMRSHAASLTLPNHDAAISVGAQVPHPSPRLAHVSVSGETRPVVYDAQQRSTGLYERIDCQMPDDSRTRVMRLECLKLGGKPIR